MADYESIYSGAANYLTPGYETQRDMVGYQVPAGEISMSIDPRTANQLREVNIKINPGEKHFEVQGLMAKNWEAMPKQHIEELNRLAKLTGTKASFHGPLVEASGVGERGWTEIDRKAAEDQLASAIIRGHELDPNGNIPVTVHSTAQLPDMKPIVKVKENGKIVEKIKSLYIINPDSGQLHEIKAQKRYFPEEGKFTGEPSEFNPEKELKRINQDQWIEQLSGINRYANFGEQSIKKAEYLSGAVSESEGVKRTPEEIQQFLAKIANEDLDKSNIPELKDLNVKERAKEAQREIEEGQVWLRDAYRNMKSLFDNTYIRASDEDKDKLKQFAEWAAPKIKEGIEKDPAKLKDFSEVVVKGLKVLGKIENPQMFVPLDKFVIDKSAETFANVATTAYEKFKDKAPIISIENPPAGSGLSRGEDLKNLVEASRKKFVENLQKKGISKGEAEGIAEKTIGVTWDVGHINMLRKSGWEDKDLIKETKTVAPFVKHVHLSDNFGFEHTELPMGMGNVPLKEELQEIEKEKGKREIRKVIEAGDYAQHFWEKGGENPFGPTLKAFNSPIYPLYEGPGWSQLGGYGSYYMGHGQINPPIHHSVYGAGLTTLPAELGGEMPGGGGERGRFAQSPG
ncbi:MAG: hypothetical protein PHH54_01805 [Candidatus Nanoarchaeia archaeon]|nr:hypothetical protein [Candidatus Nanoarchaeia archaeon]MDD5740697.1 hypothetical protein [Candidatus Nanoarchaeia archaeon]